MSEPNGQPSSATLDLIKEELAGLKVDQGKVKLREWSDLEEQTGQQCNRWIGADDPPFWFMQGVLWLWLRRKHPQLRFEDFGELDLEDLQKARSEEGPPVDPTSAVSEPPSSPTSATSGA